RALHDRDGELGPCLGVGRGAAARHPSARARLRQAVAGPAAHGRHEELSDSSSLRTPSQRIAWSATIVISALVFIFLIAPILAIMPLSFSSVAYHTYPPAAL